MKGQLKTPPLPRGTRLEDRFEIVEFLGAGSFGEVYEARQLVFGRGLRRVALKLFRPDHINADNFREVFADAITLVSLQAEGPPSEVLQRMVRVYDLGLLKSPEQRAFMSMELIDGRKTLEDAVRRFKTGSGMPVETSLFYLRQLLIVLSWMHTLDTPVIHGDLKPDNVLLSPDLKTLILTDFGLAARTSVGTVGGAIAYQSPEHIFHVGSGPNLAGPAADIYGVGLLWYELLTGEHPFRHVGLEALADDNQEAYVLAHQRARKWEIRSARSATDIERIIPASEINSELAIRPQIEAMLNCCLAFEASRRFRNGRVLLDELDRYVRGEKIKLPEGAGQQDKASDPEPAPAAPTLTQRLNDVESLLRLKRLDDADQLLTKIRSESPHCVPAKVLHARLLLYRGDAMKAQQQLAELKQQFPQEPILYDALAELYASQGQAAVADKFRQQAQQLRKSTGVVRA